MEKASSKKDLQIPKHMYSEFESWYLREYNSHIFETYEECFKFIAKSNSPNVPLLLHAIGEWEEYNKKKHEELIIIENALVIEIESLLNNLNQYGYIYDLRNLGIGDSYIFIDEEKPVSVYTKTFSIDITEDFEKDSFIEVKTNKICQGVLKAVENMFSEHISNTIGTGSLVDFKKSIKIVYEDAILHSNDGHVSVIIKIGMETIL